MKYGTLVIAWKEALEIIRDRRSLLLMLFSAMLFPLLGVMIAGLKTQQEALVVVIMCDETVEGKELLSRIEAAFKATPGFRVEVIYTNESIKGCTAYPGAVATIVIPGDFGENVTSLDKIALIYLYKVVDSPAAEEAGNILNSVLYRYSLEVSRFRVETLAVKAGVAIEPDYVLSPIRIVTNTVTRGGVAVPPQVEARAELARFLAFSVFFILNPSAIAVADSITREREQGTGEVLAITPIGGRELVLGKALGSLTAAFIAGGLDVAAVTAYVYLVAANLGPGVALFHAAQTMLAVMVTLSIVMLVTMVIPGQRAATLLASIITGLAVMVFFSILFIDLEAMPTAIKTLLYMVPYTHTAESIKAFVIGDTVRAIQHTIPLIVALVLATYAASKLYSPEKLVKRL